MFYQAHIERKADGKRVKISTSASSFWTARKTFVELAPHKEFRILSIIEMTADEYVASMDV